MLFRRRIDSGRRRAERVAGVSVAFGPKLCQEKDGRDSALLRRVSVGGARRSGNDSLRVDRISVPPLVP